MKKIVTTLILIGLLTMFLPFTATAKEYKYTLDAGKVQFSWSFDDDNIYVMLTARTKSWVAVGFNPENGMKGANIIIGYVKKGKVKIEDDYGNRKTGHRSDKKLGGTDEVLDPSGKEENGKTTIEFAFPLKSKGKYDKPVDPFGTTRVILAHGRGRDSFNSIHPFRAVYDVNLSTGESKKVE